MGYEVPLFNITLLATDDLSDKQYHIVRVDAAGQAALTNEGQNGVGIVQNAPEPEQATTVMVAGVSKVIYGAPVTAGDNLMSDANGKAVPYADPGAGVTHYKLGIALESGAADEEGTVLLKANPSVTGV